jgi:hypothetical protein
MVYNPSHRSSPPLIVGKQQRRQQHHHHHHHSSGGSVGGGGGGGGVRPAIVPPLDLHRLTGGVHGSLSGGLSEDVAVVDRFGYLADHAGAQRHIIINNNNNNNNDDDDNDGDIGNDIDVTFTTERASAGVVVPGDDSGGGDVRHHGHGVRSTFDASGQQNRCITSGIKGVGVVGRSRGTLGSSAMHTPTTTITHVSTTATAAMVMVQVLMV